MYLPLTHVMASQHGLLTRRQALAARVTDRQVRALVTCGSWVPLRRGVYADAEVWTALDEFRGRPLLRVRAAMLTLRCEYVLSHDSAGLVLGMWLPEPRTSLVHVTRRKVHGDAVRAGVKHHLAPYDDGDVVEVEGFRVLNLARTALDLGREHGLTAGVAGCDFALRHGATRSDLAAARERMWCWPGSRTMDAALEIADPGAESYLESEARVFVHELGIGRPQTQFGLSDGHRTVWCDLRVGRHVFEVDGKHKYLPDDPSDPAANEVLWMEKKRQDFVTGFKLGVSRITTHDCRGDRRPALARAQREYAATCRVFGTDITDLAPYIVRGRPF